MNEQKKMNLNVVNASETKKKDWWDELSEDQLCAIKEAEAELDARKGIPHKDVLKKLAGWL